MSSNALYSVIFIFLIVFAAPSFGQWYNLQNGTFESRFQMDTDNDDEFDLYGAPASWSSPGGILFGRDYAPDRLVESLVKLIDNRNGNGHWSLGFASVTPRPVGVNIRSRDTGDQWIIITLRQSGTFFTVAAPNGQSRYWKVNFGPGVSILNAFDANGFIPRIHFRRQSSSVITDSSAKSIEKLIESSHPTPPIN